MAEEGSRVVLSTRTKIWLLFNIVGMFVYLDFASQDWPPPGNNLYYPDAGVQIVWVLTVFPSLGFFAFANIIWVFRICSRIKRRENQRQFVYWALISGMWFLFFCYDRHRLSTSSWHM
jgi:hypothetical protein